MEPEWLYNFYYSLVFTLPAFFANSVPVYTSGLGRIDRGKVLWDGKPLLGAHKTIGGAIGGILGGGLAGIVLPLFFPDIFAMVIGYEWWHGFILGLGAIIGDAVGSFIKRRAIFNVKSGKPFPIMDQVGFIVAALLLVLPFVDYPSVWALAIIPATLVIHFLANIVAFLMGWKDVWW